MAETSACSTPSSATLVGGECSAPATSQATAPFEIVQPNALQTTQHETPAFGRAFHVCVISLALDLSPSAGRGHARAGSCPCRGCDRPTRG